MQAHARLLYISKQQRRERGARGRRVGYVAQARTAKMQYVSSSMMV